MKAGRDKPCFYTKYHPLFGRILRYSRELRGKKLNRTLYLLFRYTSKFYKMWPCGHNGSLRKHCIGDPVVFDTPLLWTPYAQSKELLVPNKIWRWVKTKITLISNFRRVLNVVCYLLGDSPASEFYMPTFRNTRTNLPMKMEQRVPKRRHIKFSRRGITEKKTCNKDNVVLVHAM